MYSKRSKKDLDWWCPLLEKAYAKLHGGYDMIAGGYSDNVLSDLTGGIGVYTGAMDKLDLEYLQYFMENCLCVSSNKKADESEYGGLDRVPHAYSMLKFLPNTELTDGSFVNLVILRNPWGRYEWTGPFSDNDEYHWSRVKDPQIRNIRVHKDEGTFAMRFTDWRRQFEALSACLIPNTSMNFETVRGVISAQKLRHAEIDRSKRIQIRMNSSVINNQFGFVWLQLCINYKDKIAGKCSSNCCEDACSIKRRIEMNIFRLPANFSSTGNDVDILDEFEKVERFVPSRKKWFGGNTNGAIFKLEENKSYSLEIWFSPTALKFTKCKTKNEIERKGIPPENDHFEYLIRSSHGVKLLQK